MPGIKIKICGVQSATEAQQLVQAGVDFIGLNFVPTSARCISEEVAESIMSVLRGSATKSTALFQDQPLDLVRDYANRLGVDCVQLHGAESPSYVRRVGRPVIKAIPVLTDMSDKQITEFIDSFSADFFLLDRPRQGQGALLSPELVHRVMAAQPDRIFLAGGLTPDNLSGVLSQVRPYGVDIAAGVRTDGQLDMTKVNRCQDIIDQAGQPQAF